VLPGSYGEVFGVFCSMAVISGLKAPPGQDCMPDSMTKP
jgi:hypothetical protein